MTFVVAELQQTLANGVQATWAATQEATQAGYATARERVEERMNVAKAGKALLESGGKATEVALGAKVASGGAAALDAELRRTLSAAVVALENSAVKLCEAAAQKEDVHPGVGGVERFGDLSEAYSLRAQLYRQLLEGLGDLPPVPELSPIENDAAVLLQIKDQCETAAQKTAEGYAHLRSRTKEALESSSANASAALKEAIASSRANASEALRSRAVCM